MWIHKHMYTYTYLPACLPLYRSIIPSFYVLIYRYKYIHPYISIHIDLYLYIFIYIYTYIYIYLSIYLSICLYIYIYTKKVLVYEMQKSAQYHIGRANSNSISLTSKPQQSVSSVGNLQAEKADLEVRAAHILVTEAWCVGVETNLLFHRFHTYTPTLQQQAYKQVNVLFRPHKFVNAWNLHSISPAPIDTCSNNYSFCFTFRTERKFKNGKGARQSNLPSSNQLAWVSEKPTEAYRFF